MCRRHHSVVYPMKITLDNTCNAVNDSTMQFRLKVCFVGSSRKSRIIQWLLADQNTNDSDSYPLEYVWTPFHDSPEAQIHDQQKIKTDEKNIEFILWDIPSDSRLQDLTPVFYTEGSLFVIVYDGSDTVIHEDILQHVKNINCHVNGSQIMLVNFHGDESGNQMTKPENEQQEIDQLLNQLQQDEDNYCEVISREINDLRLLKQEPKIIDQIRQLEEQLEQKFNLPDKIPYLHGSNTQSFNDFKSDLIQHAISCQSDFNAHQQHFSCVSDLCDIVLNLREEGTLICTSAYLTERLGMNGIQEEGWMDQDLSAMQTLGFIQVFNFSNYQQPESRPSQKYICINPLLLFQAACLLHPGDQDLEFVIDVQEFWPENSGVKKPEVGCIARNLEDLFTNGVIREIMLPLIWQRLKLNEYQTQSVIDILGKLGIIWLTSNDNRLADVFLPKFSKLSFNKLYCIPMLRLVPDATPVLNWSLEPFAGDLQLIWHYKFLYFAPHDLPARALSICKASVVEGTYSYMWSGGLLVMEKDSTVHITHGADYLNICGRINAEDGTHEECIRNVWITLACYISTVHSLVMSYKGLIYHVSISMTGLKILNKPSPEFDLLPSLQYANGGNDPTCMESNEDEALDVAIMLPVEAKCTKSTEEFITVLLDIQKTKSEGSCKDLVDYKQVKRKYSFKRHQKTKRRMIEWNLSKEDIFAHSASTKHHKKNKSFKMADFNHNKMPTVHIEKNGQIVPAEKTRKISERQTKEITYMATRFVSSIMAQAVADFVELQHQNGLFTMAQVKTSRLTADSSDIGTIRKPEDAAKAVLKAVYEAEITPTFTSTNNLPKHNVPHNTACGKITSKTCILL